MQGWYGVADAMYAIANPTKKIDMHAYRSEVALLAERYLGKQLKDIELSSLVYDLVGTATRYGLEVPPDFMLVDEASSQAVVDGGTALFAHPALAEAVPLKRRLVVPGRLTICGGPSTPAAIDILRAEVAAKVRLPGQTYSRRSCRGGAGLRRIGQPAATKTTASQTSAIL